MLKLKEVQISERKERHFGDIMTSFSSSNALRWTVRQLGQDYYRLARKGRDPLSKTFGRSYCSLRSWSVIGLCYWLLACQANGCFTTTCLDCPFARSILPRPIARHIGSSCSSCGLISRYFFWCFFSGENSFLTLFCFTFWSLLFLLLWYSAL